MKSQNFNPVVEEIDLISDRNSAELHIPQEVTGFAIRFHLSNGEHRDMNIDLENDRGEINTRESAIKIMRSINSNIEHYGSYQPHGYDFIVHRGHIVLTEVIEN